MLIAAGLLVLLIVSIPFIATQLIPRLLLNTDTGIVLIRAIANSTDQAHLALADAKLSFSPDADLDLYGIRMVRPFEPEAPDLSIDRFMLRGLSRKSSLPGRPLVCKDALFEGVRAEIHQSWVQANNGDGKPPDLPDVFPQSLHADRVRAERVTYIVHQIRRGRRTQTRLENLKAELSGFDWDLTTMSASGRGPLSAGPVILDTLHFQSLEIPDFKVQPGRIVIPEGRLTGYRGEVTIQGELDFRGGVPIPRFRIRATGLDLEQIILGGPAPRGDNPPPAGRISFEGVMGTGVSQADGSAPPPLVGRVKVEHFSLPINTTRKAALAIVRRFPGYVAGSPPRLEFGTLVGPIRIADQILSLQSLQVEVGKALITIEGHVDQQNGRLDLRLWADRADRHAPSVREARREAGIGIPDENGPEGVDASSSIDGPAAESSQAFAEDEAPTSPGDSQPASLKERIREKLKTGRSRLEAKRDALKARLEEKKAAHKAKVEAKKAEDLAEHPTLAKAMEKRDEVKDKLRAKLDSVREKARARAAARSARLREALESRLGRPTLCIRGTTAAPEISLCKDDD